MITQTRTTKIQIEQTNIDLIVDFKDNTFGDVTVQKKSKRGIVALDNWAKENAP